MVPTAFDWAGRDGKAAGGRRDGGSFREHGGHPDGGHRNDQAIFIVEGVIVVCGEERIRQWIRRRREEFRREDQVLLRP